VRPLQATKATTKTAAALPPPSRWQRRLRRIRGGPLRDPLGQSVLALSSALLGVGWGVGLLTLGRDAAAAAVLCLAAIAVAIYAAIAARAMKRDKAIRYWRDRRDLRLALARKDAQLRLQSRVLRSVDSLDRAKGPGQALGALSDLLDATYQAVVQATGADAAAVLALEAEGSYRILQAATSRRSRWTALAPGKQCPADRPLEETLSGLSRHHHASAISTSHGELRLVVLSEAPLTLIDEELFRDLPICLSLITDRWVPVSPSEPRRIGLAS